MTDQVCEPYRELLIGCGHERKKLLGSKSQGDEPVWHELTTLDINPACGPDLECDLDMPVWYASPNTQRGEQALDHTLPSINMRRQIRYRLKQDYFDEVHAYEVLEHLGSQGDAQSFFDTFNQIYALLKPRGCLYATTPSRHSQWLWGDPGHRRVVLRESLVFLDRGQIDANRKRGTPLTDYDYLWSGDFEFYGGEDNHVRNVFMLRAHKPIREAVK